MFAGYGGASFALKKAGIPFVTVGFSEIDKYAIQCYNQNHQSQKDFAEEIPNYGDATKINPSDLPDFDLLTGGFPCQAFSVAGKGLGEQDTRGTLFHDIIRIAEVKQPKYMLLENVKGLTTKRHKETFNKIIQELYRIGYFVKWKILNSKEHGIPQNRERIWFVCFRSWNEFCDFRFPEKEGLKIFLKDILEDEVEEKYYLKEEQVTRLLRSGFTPKDISNAARAGGRGSLNNKHTWDMVEIKKIREPTAIDCYNKKVKVKGIVQTLTEPHHNNLRLVEPNVVGNVNPSGRGMNGNVYAGNISPALTTNKGEGVKIVAYDNYNRKFKEEGCVGTIGRYCGSTTNAGSFSIFIPIRNANKKGFIEGFPGDGISTEQPNSATRRGRVQSQTSGCLQTKDHSAAILDDLRIRKLTPKECFRLMGFLNDEINLEGLSNSQRYKLAGNGWDINLVSKIFKEMFK